jgi:hypothetical protein
MIPNATIDELTALRSDARQSAENFSEAIKVQAEKHNVSKSALRRYICALEKDDIAKLDSESLDLATLLVERTLSNSGCEEEYK